jgi:hypothetical protein
MLGTSVIELDTSLVNRFWISDLRFWIDSGYKSTELKDFRFTILDLFRLQESLPEPKIPLIQNPKSKI